MTNAIVGFNYQIVQEGARISFTYSELNDDGVVISSNNKRSFILRDETALEKIKEIKEYLESKI